jgi:hypothetical protein
MERIAKVVVEHFDGGLTPTGVVIALVLAFSGIGGAIALAAGNLWAGLPLMLIFIALIAMFMIAAIHSDRTTHMSRAERTAKWKNAPAFVKTGVHIVLAGQIVSALIEWLIPGRSPYLLFTLFSVSLAQLVFVHGMKANKLPLHRPNQEPLTFESDPELYMKQSTKHATAAYISVGATVLFLAVFVFTSR